MKNRPQPGMHPAMDGSMYIESNHLSFISYNDCNFCKAMLWRTTSCGDDSIRAAMRLAPGEAMLLLDEVCFNRLCRPVMRSLSYYTNFFDFSILRKLL